MGSGTTYNDRQLVTQTNATVYVDYPLASIADANIRYFAEATKVISVTYTPTVAGSDGSAVTLDLKKCTGTTAPASGTTILSATLDLKGTANTVQTGTLVASQSTLTFAAGTRLAIDATGTTTAATGVLTIGYQKV